MYGAEAISASFGCEFLGLGGISILKRFLSMFLILLFCVSITACNHTEQGSLLKYDIETDPLNLDPQSAEDYPSLLVIQNIFEGLLTVNEDGTLGEGVATDWSRSDNGLQYTFSLRKDAKWFDGEPVTANDFVFAFRRLFDPKTQAPKASDFFCIKNAQDVYNGKKSTKEIGVTAQSDYQLIFELSYPNVMFLQLLTTAPAMPCNEKFFNNTKGKYGLESKIKIDKDTSVYLTASNGPFYLQSWSHDSYLKLRRNDFYKGKAKVAAFGVNFSVFDPSESDNESSQPITFDQNKTERFLNDKTDAVIVDGTIFSQLSGKGYQSDSYENTTWGILFNQNSSFFSNANIRKALFLLSDGNVYSALLPQDSITAKAIVPHNITLLNQNYRDYAGDSIMPKNDVVQAKKYFQKGMAELNLDLAENVTILVPENSIQQEIFGYISQVWQRELNFYIKVEPISISDMEKKLDTRQFDCAIVSLSGAYNSPDSILTGFVTGRSNNYAGYSNKNYDTYLSNGLKSFDMAQSADYFKKAEQLLINDGVFMPLYYQRDYFVFNSKVSGLIYYPQSRLISFAYAKKKD